MCASTYYRALDRVKYNGEGMLRRILLTLGLLFCAMTLFAHDPFEIHVYEYEPLSRGEYSLEAHLNLTTQGTAQRDGRLLPTEHQTHLTLEPTIGLSETFAIGFMFLNAWEPGYSPQFAGWRVLPRVYALRLCGGVLVSKHPVRGGLAAS